MAPFKSGLLDSNTGTHYKPKPHYSRHHYYQKESKLSLKCIHYRSQWVPALLLRPTLLFLIFRRQEAALEGSPAAKQACTDQRAIMTTQAVTPASAAAGLGLLMHPNMLMMHQMSAMANHVHGLSPQMQMLQQMQQMSHPQIPMNHAVNPVTSVAASHSAAFPNSTSIKCSVAFLLIL